MIKPRIKQATYVLLSLAVILRLIVYIRNRTLFLDEANLSRNIVEKSYGALFGALDYEQFAPPLYLAVVKFFVGIFGVNEYALRIFPFLMGLGALYLFYQLALKMFNNVGILYSVALFGFSIYIMRYQTENKQYAGDVFFMLLFILSTWHFRITKLWQYGLLGLAGGIGIWFSMPLVFTMAAIGAYLFYEQMIKGQSGTSKSYVFAGLSLTAIMWLVSFAILFVVNLKTSLDSKYLQDFHKYYYLKFPISEGNINQSMAVWNSFLSAMVGDFARVRVWSEICIVLGIWQLYKKDIGKTILLLTPILGCFVASMLGKYVLMPRVSLFMMPIFFLLIGLGAEFIFEKVMLLNKKVRIPIFAVMLLLVGYTIGSRTAIPYFVKPYEVATSRSILQRMSQHPEKHLPIYVIHIAKPSYRFYTQLYEPKIEVPSSSIQYGDWSDNLIELAKGWKEKGIEKIWIYDSHTFGQKLRELKHNITVIGDTETLIDGKHGNAYLIKLK